MSIEIKSEDGRITIRADDRSRIENIYVDGKQIVGRPPRRISIRIVLLVFGAMIALVCALPHCWSGR